MNILGTLFNESVTIVAGCVWAFIIAVIVGEVALRITQR